MDSHTIFCFGTAIPRNNIDIGHHVQGHGYKQCHNSHVHQHSADSLDNKTIMEPICRNDKHPTQMDTLFADSIGYMLHLCSTVDTVRQFPTTDSLRIYGRRIRFIDTRYCAWRILDIGVDTGKAIVLLRNKEYFLPYCYRFQFGHSCNARQQACAQLRQ